MRARVLTWKRPLCLEKSSHSFFGKRKFQLKVFVCQTLGAAVKKAHRVDYWWVLHWKRLCVRLCISGIQRRRISGRPFHRAQHTASRLLALSLALSHFHELKLHRAVHRIESLGKHYYIYLHVCVCAREAGCPFSPNDTQSHFQQLQGFFSLCPCSFCPLPLRRQPVLSCMNAGCENTRQRMRASLFALLGILDCCWNFGSSKIWPREWVWRWSFSFCLLFCQRLLFFVHFHPLRNASWLAQGATNCTVRVGIFSFTPYISPAARMHSLTLFHFSTKCCFFLWLVKV